MAVTKGPQSTRGDITAVQYKRPLSLSPWSKTKEQGGGNVWISMKPKRILDQYTKGGDAPISTDDPNVEFLFLAPLNLGENIVHHWEAYESVASRLAQKARSIIKLSNEVTAGGTAVGQKLKQLEKSFLEPKNEDQSVGSETKGNKGFDMQNFVSQAYSQVPGSKIPKVKVDTPMYYSNSDRRQLILDFQLFNETYKNDSDPSTFLLKPIQEMMKYSSPDLINQGGIDIEFPYLWEVKTEPIQFIHYRTCALIAVQPTWEAPYVNGYPISCKLQLTFQDLSPLYAGTIEYGSLINTGTNSVSNAIAADEAAKKANQTAQKPRLIRVNNVDAGR